MLKVLQELLDIKKHINTLIHHITMCTSRLAVYLRYYVTDWTHSIDLLSSTLLRATDVTTCVMFVIRSIQ